MLVILIFVQVLHAWEIKSLLKLWSASYFSDWNILSSQEYKYHNLRKYSVVFCFCVSGTWFSYSGKDTEEDIWT